MALFANTKLCLILILSSSIYNSRASGKFTDTITTTSPPFLGFYSKYLDCGGGIPVRSSGVVADEALFIAKSKINQMLENIPNARKNLIKSGAEIHIIGKDQQTSDLPEFAEMKGKAWIDNLGNHTNIDDRTRGMGGIYASCGEENLLRLPNDRYAGGSDICIHEFAHTLMNYGFDDQVRKKITEQYTRSLSAGLWKNAYAATDAGEYWAELSMWYFGFHGEFLRGTVLPTTGAKGLSNYDAGGYQLLDSIYTGKILIEIDPKGLGAVVGKGQRSIHSTEKAEISVINNSLTNVKLYWVDNEGNEELYATILPNSSIKQPTFMQHVWKIEKDGETYYLKVTGQPFEIKLK